MSCCRIMRRPFFRSGNRSLVAWFCVRGKHQTLLIPNRNQHDMYDFSRGEPLWSPDVDFCCAVCWAGTRPAPTNGCHLRLYLILLHRRETAPHGVLGDYSGNHEMEEIVGTARLGAGPGHPGAAERLAPDQRPGDVAVEVEVADP